MQIDYKEMIIPEKTYNSLRETVGWGKLDREAVTKALPKSVYCICAIIDNEIIAFARVVGDGGLCFYIQEIIVDPKYQRQGIASKFMEYIFAFFKRTAIKRSYIGVFVGKGLESFYERFGFWKRPTNEMGPGMMQFWNDTDFNAHFNRA